MIPYVKLDEVLREGGARTGFYLLDERHGCVNGCCCGVSLYTRDEYGPQSSHDDQEGFFILEGRGRALVDGEEIVLEPGVAFIVPAHIPHAMKKDPDCPCCKALWFHAAV